MDDIVENIQNPHKHHTKNRESFTLSLQEATEAIYK